MAWLDEIIDGMLHGNFSAAILVVGLLQLAVAVVSLVFLIKRR